MIRMQIRLTEEQAAKLRRIADERGVSMAQVIPDAGDRFPHRGDRRERFERAIHALKRSHFHGRGQDRC
jgi:hypothetical protein